MIKRTALLVALLTTVSFGFSTNLVQAEAAQKKTACEKKADKKKITDEKKRAAYIKKCEKKASKAKQ
ncbi:MAG: hypothetical protein OEY52_14760 [Gammaproteobacteria bacterium]|nr:hypothetical protein [Gammaproteobacteria bacterium]